MDINVVMSFKLYFQKRNIFVIQHVYRFYSKIIYLQSNFSIVSFYRVISIYLMPNKRARNTRSKNMFSHKIHEHIIV